MKPSECHFFLSSLGRWIVTGPDLDLRAAMKSMDRDGLAYNLWFVPLPSEADYEIGGYAPLVEGAAWCDTFYPKRKTS
jgi:hypothetical protein